ncbi:MAG TPA: lmo0937 family membrane protein [Flavobacteriales bacterium]|nr:lmo0937 family membrane protein [Flavobacteriales bacterium]
MVAVLCVIGWIFGAFVYTAGALIHLLLVLAVIAILLGIIRKANTE